jgi:hypothetical protein
VGSSSMKRNWRRKADRIQGKVRSARCWHLTVLVVEQVAPLLAIALCLRIVQVILGVRIGPSPGVLWIGGLAVALMLAWVVFRVVQRLRTPYEIAQLLDAGSHLHDSFSTAWFLLANPGYATGPEVAAHIAHATTRVSEIRLRTLFPLPAKRLFVVAFLVGVLGATASRIPSQSGRSGRTGDPGSPPRTWEDLFRVLSDDRSAETSSRSNSKENPQTQEERELPGIASRGGAPNHNMIGPQQAQSGQLNDRTTQPPDIQDHLPVPGEPGVEESGNEGAPNEVTSHVPASDRSSVANAPAKAPSETANAGAKNSHEDRAGDSGSSKASLASQLLSPMKRLFDMARQQLRAAEAATNRTAPAAGNNVASDRLQAAPQGQGSNQRTLPPGYSSAEASAQQAAGSLPPSIGGGHPKTAADSRDGSFASVNVIDLVDTNPSGDTGHTRILALQNTRSGQQLYSTDSDHHADSARQILQDEVPLAYQRPIQAYLEHPREQQR